MKRPFSTIFRPNGSRWRFCQAFAVMGMFANYARLSVPELHEY